MSRSIIMGIMYAIVMGVSPTPSCETRRPSAPSEQLIIEDVVSGCEDIRDAYEYDKTIYSLNVVMETLAYMEWSDSIENNHRRYRALGKIAPQRVEAIYNTRNLVPNLYDNNRLQTHDLLPEATPAEIAENEYIKSHNRLVIARQVWNDIDAVINYTERAIKHQEIELEECE